MHQKDGRLKYTLHTAVGCPGVSKHRHSAAPVSHSIERRRNLVNQHSCRHQLHTQSDYKSFNILMENTDTRCDGCSVSSRPILERMNARAYRVRGRCGRRYNGRGELGAERVFLRSNSLNARLVKSIFDKLSQNAAGG